MASNITTQDYNWTDDLPLCQHSGIGSHPNQVYRADGGRISTKEFEDSFFHFRTEDEKTYLYAIFDGYGGKKVASFAHQMLPVELLLGQLEGQVDDKRVKNILHQAIQTVERSFFESIDQLLADKPKMNPPERLSDHQLFSQYPKEMSDLKEVEENFSGGSALLVALLHHGRLYVANVGDSRALLCTKQHDDSLSIQCMSVDHSLSNDDEVLRLEHLGLATNTFQNKPLFGNSCATRTIGNHRVKGGYREIPALRHATREPIIAEPDVTGGIDLSKKKGFLVMYTHGFWQALEAATGTQHVDFDIATMVENEFRQQRSLSSVAQAVVNRVVRMHHDAFMNGGVQAHLCKAREDITIIVRNFDYPLQCQLYIPSRNDPIHNPSTTPVFPSPSSGSIDGESSQSTPVISESTPTPKSTDDDYFSNLQTNNSSPSGSGQLLSSGNDNSEEETIIDAYVDLADLDKALLTTKMADMYIDCN